MGDAIKGTIGGVVDTVTGGKLFGDSAEDRAIAAQREGMAQANDTSKYVFDMQRKDQEPWREAGVKALAGLGGDEFQQDFNMANFQQDPGYQFRMQEGQKALERSAAARGGLNSGATLKALSRYGQDFATNEYQNAYNRFNSDRDRRFNRLSSLAGIGQTANNQVGNAAAQYGQNISSNYIGMGNAIGAANISKANRDAKLMEQGISAGSMAFSDERLKKNIQRISKEDLEELRRSITPYTFNYIDAKYGEGDWIGVMAQDLQKSKLGRTIVFTDENGHKQVDLKKAMSLFLASMAEG